MNTINKSNVFKKLDVKDDSRLLFCSDIHGELGFLLESLNKIGFEKGKDILVHAGDLVDRGTESLKTAQFFCNDSSGSFHSILGNHDMFSINQNYDLWFLNGGQWILDDLPDHDDKMEFSEMMKTLPLIIEVNHKGYTFGVTHACVPYEFENWQDFVEFSKSDINDGLIEEITWTREFVEYRNNKFYTKAFINGVDYVIHGHTVVKEPTFVANRLHIDTGLVYGKYLTIAEFVNGEFVFHKFSKDNSNE